MKAIILAAGTSKRMGSLTSNSPKCLLEIGDKTIIEHQIECLMNSGIKDIVVVTGFCEDKLKKVCGNCVSYISNSRFATTNSMYSLWLTREVVQEGFVVLNSDVFFHPMILEKLLKSHFPDALTLCRLVKMGKEEMKVKIHSEKVIDISKDLSPSLADGENLGIVKFSSKGAKVLFKKVNEIISQGIFDKWTPFAFQQIISHYDLYAVDISGLPWIEIDFLEDYEKAKKVIYPNIISHT